MTRCTTVDKHELSVVVNPNQQVPQASNTCQWCDGSIRRPHLRLLSSKRHSVTIGDQFCFRQDWVPHINHFKRHFRWNCNYRNLNLNVTYDAACPLAVRSVTAHTSKPVSLLRSACGASRSSTMIQLSSRVTALTVAECACGSPSHCSS